MKKLIYTLSFLFILVAFVWFFLIKFLSSSGISYANLSFNFPSTIKIHDLKIKTPNFKLNANKIELDISWLDLLHNEFRGNTLLVEKATIVIKPSDAPFSYSVIPFIDYKNIRIEDTKIIVQNAEDTISLLFPDVKISNLQWNDSILVDKLYYSQGEMRFAYFSEPKIEKDTAYTSILVPKGVPKFKVYELEVFSTNVSIVKPNSVTAIKKIHLDLLGLNNYSGAGINVKSLGFILQDTLAVKISSNKLYVENYKGASVHGLSFKAPGIDVNVKSIHVEEKGRRKSVSLQLNKSSFSPSLMAFFTGNNKFFKSEAPPVCMQGFIRYANDTLEFEKCHISFLKQSGIRLSGRLVDPGKRNIFDLKISPIEIYALELNKLLFHNLPPSINTAKLSGKISLIGTPENFLLSGPVEYNSSIFGLSAKIVKHTNKHWLAQTTINSPCVNLATLYPEIKQPITIYNFGLQTDIDLASSGGLEELKLKISSDSIKTVSTRFYHPNIFASFHQNEVTLWAESAEQAWKVQLKTIGGVSGYKPIDFVGYVVVDDLGKIIPDFHTGVLHTSLSGNFSSIQDSLSCNINLDSVLLTSSKGIKNRLSEINIGFTKNQNDYFVKMHHQSKNVFEATFDKNLIDWFKQSSRKIEELPPFFLSASFLVDSSFTEQFLNSKIHLDVRNVSINSNNQGFVAKMEFPFVGYKTNYITGVNFSLDYTEKKKDLNIFFQKITNPYLNVDSLLAQAIFVSDGNLDCSITGIVSSLHKPLSIAGRLSLLPNTLQLTFDKRNALQFGNQFWRVSGENRLQLNTKENAVSGDITFSNGTQKIDFKGNNDVLRLSIDSLELGPMADLFVKNNSLDAQLNSTATFLATSKKLDINGDITNISLDSVSLGYMDFKGKFEEQDMALSLNSKSSSWAIRVEAFNKPAKKELDVSIDHLSLQKLDSVFKLFSKDYELSGNLEGNLKVVSANTFTTTGKLVFDTLHFKSKELGTVADVFGQEIVLSDNRIYFKKFLINDENKNQMALDGQVDLFGKNKYELSVVSKRFDLLNSQSLSSQMRGRLSVESNLKVSGDVADLNISGDFNVLKGGNIYYVYKSSVSLDGSNNTVSYVSFKNERPQLGLRKQNTRTLPINWNVNTTIGATEIYVLLNKTKEEYVKLNASGELQLRKGTDILPAIFGSINGSQGKVYYEVPLVSDIKLDILLAKIAWNGDVKEPVLNFKGVETFRVTPYEMSPELKDNKNRVPVDVEAFIDNKTLKNLEINFDMQSSNADIQNMLTALPAETREAYAINMLIFGRINNDAKAGNSSMSAIVNKLNEISRRNLKNADLSFHVDNNTESDLDASTGNNVGYSFSKGFFSEKLKVTVGGNFEFGSNPDAKSSPLGTIQMDYELNADPNITLRLQRENSYRGPIEGQVDESGILLNYTKNFKNVFKYKSIQKTDSLTRSKK